MLQKLEETLLKSRKVLFNGKECGVQSRHWGDNYLGIEKDSLVTADMEIQASSQLLDGAVCARRFAAWRDGFRLVRKLESLPFDKEPAMSFLGRSLK